MYKIRTQVLAAEFYYNTIRFDADKMKIHLRRLLSGSLYR